MSTIDAGFSVSLDGFVADENDDISRLYGWMVANADRTDDLDEMAYTDEGRGVQEERSAQVGAIVAGRRTFDLARGWGGRHPLGVPVVVLTHDPPAEWAGDEHPFTFVTTGVEDAVAAARDLAGDRPVSVCGPDVMRQCLRSGLLDEVGIDLVPVLLGRGVPLFTPDCTARLEKVSAVDAPGVTHLRYRVVG